MKCKGLTQSVYTENFLEWNGEKLTETGRKLDIDLLEKLLTEPGAKQVVIYPDTIKRNPKSHTISSITSTKTLQKVYDKRVLLPDFTTIPYGTVF